MKFKLSDAGAVRAFAKLPQHRVNEVMKRTAITAYERLTRRAPVLTGRYRWGFNCSVNGIDYIVPDPAPPEYAKKKQVYYQWDPEKAAKAFVEVSADDVVIISNSLPYAEALENGHSKQAPAGIFRVTIPEIKEDIKRYARLMSQKDGGL